VDANLVIVIGAQAAAALEQFTALSSAANKMVEDVRTAVDQMSTAVTAADDKIAASNAKAAESFAGIGDAAKTEGASLTGLSGEIDKVAASQAKLGESSTAAAGEIKTATDSEIASYKAVADAAEAAAGKVAAANEAMGASAKTGAGETAAATAAARGAVGEDTAAMGAGMAAAGAASGKMGTATKAGAGEVEAETGKAGQAATAMGEQLVGGAAKAETLSGALTGAGVGVQSFGSKFGPLGALIAGAVVSMIAVGAESTKMAGDFESSTQRLVSSAGEIPQNLDMVRQGMVSMSSQVGVSAEDLSKAMYKVESGGQHGADGLLVLKAAAQGAKTENADLTTVADALTSALTDYHLGADQAANVTSKLVAATGQGKMTFQELASSMSSILPIASAAGISLNDILGDLASMTEHGITAQQATQNLSNAVRNMTQAGGPAQQELAALGINATQLSADLGSKGLSGTMNEIQSAIQAKLVPGIKDSKMILLDLNNALHQLPPSVQKVGQAALDGTGSWAAYKKAASALDPVGKGLAQNFLSLATRMHGMGTQAKNGAEIYQTYDGAMQKATGGATGLKVALMLTGENAGTTSKAIKAVTDASADAAGNVAHWDEIQQTFNQKLAEGKAALQQLGMVVGQYVIPPMTAVIGVIMKVVQWMSQHEQVAKALGVGIATVLVVALVALAVVAGTVVAAAVVLGAALVGLKHGFESIGHGISVAAHWLAGLGDSIAKLEQTIMGALHNAINWLVGIGKDIVTGLWNGIKEGWKIVLDGLNSLTGGLVDKVKGLLGISSPSTVFAGIGGDSMAGWKLGVDAGVQPLQNATRGASDKMLSVFDTAKTQFTAAGTSTMSSFGDGFDTTADQVTNSAQDFSNTLSSTITDGVKQLTPPMTKATQEIGAFGDNLTSTKAPLTSYADSISQLNKTLPPMVTAQERLTAQTNAYATALTKATRLLTVFVKQWQTWNTLLIKDVTLMTTFAKTFAGWEVQLAKAVPLFTTHVKDWTTFAADLKLVGPLWTQFVKDFTTFNDQMKTLVPLFTQLVQLFTTFVQLLQQAVGLMAGFVQSLGQAAGALGTLATAAEKATAALKKLDDELKAKKGDLAGMSAAAGGGGGEGGGGGGGGAAGALDQLAQSANQAAQSLNQVGPPTQHLENDLQQLTQNSNQAAQGLEQLGQAGQQAQQGENQAQQGAQGLGNQLGQTGQQAQGLAQQLRDLSNQVERLAPEMTKLYQDGGQVAQGFMDDANAGRAMANALEQGAQAGQAQDDMLKQLKQDLDDAGLAMGKTAQQSQNLSDNLREAGPPTQNLSDNLQELNGNLNQLGTTALQDGEHVQGLGQALGQLGTTALQDGEKVQGLDHGLGQLGQSLSDDQDKSQSFTYSLNGVAPSAQAAQGGLAGLSGGLSSLSQQFEDAGNSLDSSWGVTMAGLQSTTQQGMSGMSNSIQNGLQQAKEDVSNAAPEMEAAGHSLGQALDQGMANGISDGQGAVDSAASDAGASAASSAGDGAGAQSPSWKTYRTGMDLISGMVNALHDGAHLGAAAGADLGKQTAASVDESLGQAGLKAGTKFGINLLTGIRQVIPEVQAATSELARSAVKAADLSLIRMGLAGSPGGVNYPITTLSPTGQGAGGSGGSQQNHFHISIDGKQLRYVVRQEIRDNNKGLNSVVGRNMGR